jgi:hypothetical protein
MGLSALAALLFVGLAFMAQSPRFLARTPLAGYRLDLRARTFTGYGFALLLLTFGFFLAGVPLGEEAGLRPTAVAETNPTPAEGTLEVIGGAIITPETGTSTRPTSLTPASGAFGGPPPGLATEEPDDTVAETTSDATPPTSDPASSPAPLPTATAVPNTPTRTPTPTSTPTATPTITPTPTLTPTPIEGETAVITLGGGTVWLRRSPDGQNLLILNDGDTVILRGGHANRTGILWREVSTVQGDVGWIQANFLRAVDS